MFFNYIVEFIKTPQFAMCLYEMPNEEALELTAEVIFELYIDI